MIDALVIPDDPNALKALCEQQAALLAEQALKIDTQQAYIQELKLTIEHLTKLCFGRRSEQYHNNPDQHKLDFGDDIPEATADLPIATSEQAALDEEFIAGYTRKKKEGAKTRNEQLPPHLERYEVEAEATDEQKHCSTHGERKVIGFDRVETLEFIAPKLKVRVTLIPKYVCEGSPACGVASPEPPAGLVGSRYDTSVAAQIIVAKYGYHMPIYREQDFFASSGWTPSRSTLLNISTHTNDVIVPFVAYLADCVRTDSVVGTDDTSVTLIVPQEPPPLDPDNPRSKRIHEVLSAAIAKGEPSIDAKMWAYRGVHVALNVFDFTISRHRDGPDEFLVDTRFEGVMLGDCYSGYAGITLRSDGLVLRAACNAHARRKVFDARSNHPIVSATLLAMYQELYDIESRGKAMSDDARLQLRQEEAVPIWLRMRSYLDSDAVRNLLPKEAIGKAVAYLNNQWEALQVYLTDGGIPIDNNDTEQLMKQVALGRKNWLFVGSVAAGVRAANFMTVVSSALRNDLDVWAYVKDLLDQLLAGNTDYHSLRPDIWAQAHPEHIRQYRRDERRDRADRKQFHRALRRRALA